jgi:hypothetical protein
MNIFLGYFEWTSLTADSFKVKDKDGKDYKVSEFGGNYTIVLYAWSDNYQAVTPLSVSSSLSIQKESIISLSVHSYYVNGDGTTSSSISVSGTWSFKNEITEWLDASEEGDALVLAVLDREGV